MSFVAGRAVTLCLCCHGHGEPQAHGSARRAAPRRLQPRGGSAAASGGGSGDGEQSQAGAAAPALTPAAAAAASLAAAAASAGSAAAEVLTANGQPFVPPAASELGWEIWVGFVAGVIPFLIASYEFGKRIVSGQAKRAVAAC